MQFVVVSASPSLLFGSFFRFAILCQHGQNLATTSDGWVFGYRADMTRLWQLWQLPAMAEFLEIMKHGWGLTTTSNGWVFRYHASVARLGDGQVLESASED